MAHESMLAPSAIEAAEAASWLRAQVLPGADLVADSRAVRPGSVFFAYPGERADGRSHIARAVQAGAAAIVYEQDNFVWPGALHVPHRPVAGLRALAGAIASAWWNAPSAHLSVVAVTGTNGKTSTSHWIAQLLGACGRRCGVVGTLGAGEPHRLEPFGLTTPDAITLQRLFAKFVDAGLDAAAIEASSIGLHQQRLAGTRVQTAVFTNLTRDHLDYHGDMAAYGQAKARLFEQPGLRTAVVNLDDAAARMMLDAAAASVQRIGYSMLEARPSTQAEPSAHAGLRVDRGLRAVRIAPTQTGTAVALDGDWGRAEVELALIGRHNVQNMLAVLGAALAEGIAFEQALAQLAQLAPVPGRMQTVTAAGAPLAVIDYAHTPDALANALAALAPVAAARGGRLWCLFGAGGDRDAGKRPLMGEVASRLADAVVLASDNPRSEPPAAILDQIAQGLVRPARFVELDRRAAIERTLRAAAPEDVVLIAGKGHEDYQEAQGVKTPFSDVEVARAAIAQVLEGAVHV